MNKMKRLLCGIDLSLFLLTIFVLRANFSAETFQGNSRRNQGVFVRRLRLQYLQEAHARQVHETSALGHSGCMRVAHGLFALRGF